MTGIWDTVAGAWGLAADHRVLGGDVDRNIRATVAAGVHAGEPCLVKLSPPGTPPAELSWRDAVLATVGKAGLPCGVPRIIPTRDGAARLSVDGWSVQAVSWVDGAVMADIPVYPAELLRDLGRVSAELTVALSPLDVHRYSAGHPWLAVDSAVRIRDAVAGPGASRYAAVAVEAAAECERAAAGVGGFGTLPQATVHQDLNGDNVMVSTVGPQVTGVGGVIDFNDATFTARVADVALCCAYAMQRFPDPAEAVALVTGGYGSVLSLTAAERRVLGPLALARVCASWAAWSVREAVNAADAAAGVTGAPSDYATMRRRQNEPLLDRVARQGVGAFLAELG
ncbi:phosphotransferase [Corynebacterium nuruki]|uniref:Hydroxylysine kinase n=1 Tax=Corynebacterium nuruki TaxID=1032851 RepID=A0A3D4SZE5_9CORY|nr:phosphotransferase [Corynebacterium nuruki]HCT14673.1 hypothetical protein [Corynebacterium nuruki]